MSSSDILKDLINTYGILEKEKNDQIIEDFFKNNPNITSGLLKKFIEYYNSISQKPINQYAIDNYFRYMSNYKK